MHVTHACVWQVTSRRIAAIESRSLTQRALVRVLGLRVVLARGQRVPPRLHTGRRKRRRGRGAGGAHGVRPPADEGVGSCGRVGERARARTVAFGVHGAWERRRTQERAKALPARASLMNPRRAVIQGRLPTSVNSRRLGARGAQKPPGAVAALGRKMNCPRC